MMRRDAVADQRQASKIIRAAYMRNQSMQHGEHVYEEVLSELLDDHPDESLLDKPHNQKSIAGTGVCVCGQHLIPDTEAHLMRVPRGVDDDQYWQSYVTGRQMCGLRWVCPICTAKRAEIDRQTVNDGLAAGREKGLWPVMMTFTTRHFKYEKATDVLVGIIKAEQMIKNWKPWRKLRNRGQLVAYAKVLEWTYGRRGHHPHIHMIGLFSAENEEAALEMAYRLKGSYLKALDQCGRDGTSVAAQEHSFQAQDASAAEQYLTKWGSAEELTGAQKKAGRGEGLTMWQLLRMSRTAEATASQSVQQVRDQYARVWLEIVQATKGKAQLFKNADWKALVDEYRAEEEEPAEPQPQSVMYLGVQEKGYEAPARFERAKVRLLSIREAAESVDNLAAAIAAAEAAFWDGPTDTELIGGMSADPDDMLVDDLDLEFSDDEAKINGGTQPPAGPQTGPPGRAK